MRRYGVIGDTHIDVPGRPLPDEVLAAFAGVECILHTGDITCQAVLDQLAAIAPMHAVFGNTDPPELAARLPERLVLELAGARIGLTHGHLGRGATTPERARAAFADVPNLQAIVFGHSHQPYNTMKDGILLFNPGSPTQPRRQPYPSYGLLEIEDGDGQGTICWFGMHD